jgi:hypothetical protein
MGINFDELKNKAEGLLNEHGDKIEGGLDKVADFAKQKFGHEDQIDTVVDKAKDFIPDKPQGGDNNPDNA